MKKIAVGMAVTLLLVGCSASPSSQVKGDNSGTGTTNSKGTTAEFRVKTDGKVSITWGTTSGTSQVETSKDWTKKVSLDTFDGATLIVSNGDFMKSVKVSCEILINGVSKAKNSASGKSAVASCNASSLG